MPTYDYHCESCGHTFEIFHGMSQKPSVRCPKCGKRRVRRLVGTGAGLIFKGSGFYITDYKKGPIKPESSAPAAAKPAKESGKTNKKTE